MTPKTDAAQALQGEALPEDRPDDLPKVGGDYSRLPNGRVVARVPDLPTPTAVPAADPDPTQED